MRLSPYFVAVVGERRGDRARRAARVRIDQPVLRQIEDVEVRVRVGGVDGGGIERAGHPVALGADQGAGALPRGQGPELRFASEGP